MSVTTDSPRWVLNGFARQYDWAQCRFCGRAQNHDCAPVACLACGSVQCHGNGSRDGTCAVCHHGYLPGWSRSESARVCGYAKCGKDAVATAPRVRQVCADHLGRATVTTYADRARRVVTLVEYIAQRAAHRDSGKGWEHWRWVG
jgi:hypothetical protein